MGEIESCNIYPFRGRPEGLKQDLERDREHPGGLGATRGKRGAALWGLRFRRRFVTLKNVSSQTHVCAVRQNHFLNYSKTRSQFYTSHGRSCLDVLAIRRHNIWTSPTLAQSTLRQGGGSAPPAPAIFGHLLGGRGPLGLPGGPNRPKRGPLCATQRDEISSRRVDRGA
jgi:hypothetical protein